MSDLSRRDEIELFIAQYCLEHFGNAPSTREIADAFGLSQQTVYFHMRQLMNDSRLDTKDGKWFLVGASYIPPERLDQSDVASFDPAQKASAKRGPYFIDDLKVLYRQQDGKCWWCSKPLDGIYEVDHRVPASQGGSSDAGNYCLSCPDCNSKKSDKMPHEFNGRLL